MPHRRAAGAVEVSLAPDIGSNDGIGLACFKRGEFVVAQLPGECGLGDGIGPGGAAAQVGISNVGQVKAQAGEDAFHRATEFLRMLQGAGAVHGQARGRVEIQGFEGFIAQYLDQITRESADALGFGGIIRVVFE